MEFETGSETQHPQGLLEMCRQMMPQDAPLCFYWQEADVLDVLCGEPPCTTFTSWSAGPAIMRGIDVIQKMYEKDFASGGDSFAGIQISGGVQDFLSHNYRRILAEDYEAYRREHNAQKWAVPISEIVQFLLEDERGLVLPEWKIWQERVMKALSEQRPEVHIPLI
ncbi:MAG: hypothetical protein NUV78_03435 [Candidatus Zambryskibacteria bacterium]|nr:hypothetical protein [Candidatus Zambryskibacteria bacterium]